MVAIDDIQVRLRVKVEGVIFTSSWYGPGDQLRFAALTYAPRPIDLGEQARPERIANGQIEEKKAELEEALNGSHEESNTTQAS
jgi:hypothetical protein